MQRGFGYHTQNVFTLGELEAQLYMQLAEQKAYCAELTCLGYIMHNSNLAISWA